ncbi:MAG: hypothetical protein ACR2M4_14240 [Actinomycetota bacterium]
MEFDELLGNEELAPELGFVVFELLDAPVLGVVGGLRLGSLGAWPSRSSCAGQVGSWEP